MGGAWTGSEGGKTLILIPLIDHRSKGTIPGPPHNANEVLTRRKLCSLACFQPWSGDKTPLSGPWVGQSTNIYALPKLTLASENYGRRPSYITKASGCSAGLLGAEFERDVAESGKPAFVCRDALLERCWEQSVVGHRDRFFKVRGDA